MVSLFGQTKERDFCASRELRRVISQPGKSGMREEDRSSEGWSVFSELYVCSLGGFLLSKCKCLRFYRNREITARDIHATSESLRHYMLEAVLVD